MRHTDSAAGTATAADATAAMVSGLLGIEWMLGIPGITQAIDSAAIAGLAPFVAIRAIFAVAVCYGVAALRR